MKLVVALGQQQQQHNNGGCPDRPAGAALCPSVRPSACSPACFTAASSSSSSSSSSPPPRGLNKCPGPMKTSTVSQTELTRARARAERPAPGDQSSARPANSPTGRPRCTTGARGWPTGQKSARLAWAPNRCAGREFPQLRGRANNCCSGHPGVA